MKILRISLFVILVVLSGWVFNADAQTETNLHSFGGSPNDGAYPLAGLIQGSDGSFYGTTSNGGTEGGQYGGGTVFRISPSGTYTTLYFFGSSDDDGVEPQAALVQGNDGNLYGTTTVSGINRGGTVFRISASGDNTNLYSFGGSDSDGEGPNGLVQGSDGNFYGTTYVGGTGTNCFAGCGTIFRISPSGNETVLHSFGVSSTDGASPVAGLVQGSDGNFYGTALQGGASTNCFQGCGTIFRISPSGSYTNLYSFGTSDTDGYSPWAGLVQGSDGNLYGTTQGGLYGEGTVYRISSTGSFTNLYSFDGTPNDGQLPYGLVQGSDGNFYGMTSAGGTGTNCGSIGCGIIFRISPSGNYTNLYSFGSFPNDGTGPFLAALVQGSDGSFYGTAEGGGGTTNSNPYSGDDRGYGNVFKLTMALNPPANQINRIKSMGSNIVVSIPSVAGETYQLQYRNSLTSGSWSNIPNVSVTNSLGSILSLTNFAGANQSQGFYRFAITP